VSGLASPVPPLRRARKIRIGVADSGINPRDPQVGRVEGGIGLRFRDGRIERDYSWEDVLGHGTAVAATIRGHAPDAALYSIRIFRRRLEAPIESLLHAIDWAASEGLDMLNLSLGLSSDPRREAVLESLARAAAAGVAIVTPADELELPGVVSVAADADLENDELRDVGGRLRASPWARTRGELPRERNFHGTSFAVAHVSGIAARLMAEDESLSANELPRALSRLAAG
jgi:Subtilase family